MKMTWSPPKTDRDRGMGRLENWNVPSWGDSAWGAWARESGLEREGWILETYYWHLVYIRDPIGQFHTCSFTYRTTNLSGQARLNLHRNKQ